MVDEIEQGTASANGASADSAANGGLEGAARATTPAAPPNVVKVSQGGGAVYLLGTIGALVWFLGRAKGPKGYALGVARSFVWPALLVFAALRVVSSGEDPVGAPEPSQ